METRWQKRKENLPPWERPCSVYIFGINNGEFYKIGISFYVLERFGQIQNATPYQFEIICSKEFRDKFEAQRVEKRIHDTLKDNWVVREWFKLNKDELANVIKILINS